MTQKNHWAIYSSGLSLKSDFIKALLKGEGPEPFEGLKGKKAALFSNQTLTKFIKEEVLHDDYTLSEKEHRSIRTFSSGEQKKVLLNYLLSKNPDFLIVDGLFDMLDKQSVKQLMERLESLSSKITIIQVFRRLEDLLPFVTSVFWFKNDELHFSGTIPEFRHKYKLNIPVSLKGTIPSAPKKFKSISHPFIKFRNVSVHYGEKAILNGINWEIKQGEFWQLIGANGSGKTTLLTMVTGDNIKAYGQDLTLFGQKKGSGESVWDIKKKIGYVTPAMTVLFKGRHTVENMVISGLYDSIGLYKKPSTLEKKLAKQWIDLIGLTDLKAAWFEEISEEHQCLVLIARAMIKHPPLLILDEPTHGLSDHNAGVLTALVNKFAQESQTTIIYVSHKEERNLTPKKIYELKPSKNGSEGRIII